MTARGPLRDKGVIVLEGRPWRQPKLGHKLVVMNTHSEPLVTRIHAHLEEVRGRRVSVAELSHGASQLAPLLLELCEAHVLPRDAEQVALLSRLMTDQRGQTFTTMLTDRAYRSGSKKRTVEQAQYLLRRVGAPTYLGPLDKVGLQALRSVGGWVPTLTGTAMLNRIRHESSAFILPDGPALEHYLAQCLEEEISVNVNHLGEEVLGEGEAERRVIGYIQLLQRPGVETMSVKASSIASQLDPLAFESSVTVLVDRLRRIYHAAQQFPRGDGRPKLVVLDMESYRDVDVTVAAFQRALSEPRLVNLSAGIALQTYLPETLEVFERIAAWATQRVQRGGAAIRVRLVKGANLAMERVEASLHGWRVPVLPSKMLVDANFKRVLLAAASHPLAVKLGVGSHNLFDVCFGLMVRSSRQLHEELSFEFLHGMADPLQRSLRQLGASVLVYTPIVGEHEFPSAIAYLVRRLDENTSADNYLRHSFGMRVGSPEWEDQNSKFRAACSLIEERVEPHGRGADRRLPLSVNEGSGFENEADTDFALAGNREWIHEHLRVCRERCDAAGYHAASRVGGTLCTAGGRFEGFDPSRPGVVPYRGILASGGDIERALSSGTLAATRVPPTSERRRWLSQAATVLRRARGELIALMVMDAGKRVAEGDVEVSEAIDFAEYYAETHDQLEQEAKRVASQLAPRGLTVVTPPWNFPLAIPLGGVFAALIAGNPVILKPALETPLVATRACELLWDAGIPQDWLQLVISEDEVASRLITDQRTRIVVLTGGTATAHRFLEMRPKLRLLAETGGKNSLYVSDMSDRELAIADIVRSAFGHAGQKCSALSQLILHREVYDDRTFRETLMDAVMSLDVGSAWNASSVVTPMIMPPNEHQRRALTERGTGESWLVAPRIHDDNPRLVSPGIKMGVQPGSPAHVTEYFCPLVSVLSAPSLRDALHIANGTRYGLTAGIHSLDEREQVEFAEHIHAGNLYINRPITGAVVRRQPFGGWKDSSFGPGAKAGGPNYVGQFVYVSAVDDRPGVARESTNATPRVGPATLTVRQVATLQPLLDLLDAGERSMFEQQAAAYATAFSRHYAHPRDMSDVLGEDNQLVYRPLRGVALWVTRPATLGELALLSFAAMLTGCPVRWFYDEEAVSRGAALGLDMTLLSSESGFDRLLYHLERGEAERLRVLGNCTDEVRRLANRRNIAILDEPISPLPQLELLVFLREQAISNRYHRYGNLGLRQGANASP